MNKLPLIEPKKKPNKFTKGIYPIQNEDDKRKNNIYGNNYDIAINYYTRNINNDKNNTTFLIKRAICYLAKGYYTLALKDALRTIEIDENFNKGYYEFQKKIDELLEQNEKKKESIKQYIEKIKQERMGVKTDEKGNVYDKLKELNNQIKDLNIEIDAAEAQILPIRTKFNTLNDKVKSYEKYHFPNHLNKLNAEIKKIKEKISFAPVSVNEESELTNRKYLMEEYQKALKEFVELKKRA